jgi:RHS repeat-associated protein
VKKIIFSILAVGFLTGQLEAQTTTWAKSERFIRAQQNGVSQQSFVIPLDSQKGVKLADTGDNSDKFNAGLPWFQRIAKQSRSHFVETGTSVAWNLTFENPIVAFGSESGGTPLYVNKTYDFGLYTGSRVEGTSLESNIADVVIWVYPKSSLNAGQTNVSPSGTPISFQIPRRDTAAWDVFRFNGYKLQATDPTTGLNISLRLVEDLDLEKTWGVDRYVSPLILSLRASSPDYYYRVEAFGVFKFGNTWHPTTVASGTATAVYNNLFTVGFEERPAWTSVRISQPHFEGEPVPPAYQDKSVEELLRVSTPVTKNLGSTQASYKALDASPELRTHPVLDKFVADMGSDPLALANYVLNEIELTDAIAYNDVGDVDAASINAGGMNRSAFGTFMEGQGSPLEQCALLVYLLRKADVNAVYVFPPRDELKMLDARMSKLLRMQLKGLVDHLGESNVPHLIPVNYPWVAAWLNVDGVNKWVHIFPWLKDTEIVEGYDVFDYLPDSYNTGQLWTLKYLLGDSSILSLDAENDTVASLFPKFIENSLRTNHPGMSYDDLGIKIRDRKNYYSHWGDFPQPWSVTENSGTMALRHELGTTPQFFDTIKIHVFSDRNDNGVRNNLEPEIETADLRTMDVHNRRFLLHYKKTSGANNHDMYLTMAPYRPGTSGAGDFVADNDILKRQQVIKELTNADSTIVMKITHKRQLALSGTFTAPSHWTSPIGITAVRDIEQTTRLKKGDLNAVCLNFGRVSQKMVNQHIEDWWDNKRTSSTDAEVFQGATAYIMGMSYYEKVCRFQEELQRLTKTRIISQFSSGFSRLGADRNPNGTLINNGQISLVAPVVDMSFNWLAHAGNGTYRPDQNAPSIGSMDDFVCLAVADISAQEHTVIDSYFKQSDSASTVKLLHLNVEEGKDVVYLTKNNFEVAADASITVGSTTKTLEEWCGPSFWGSITAGFDDGAVWHDYQAVIMTYGPQKGAGDLYLGIGAFVLTPDSASALITPDLNGGYGTPVASNSFDSFTNMNLSIGSGFTPSISLSPATNFHPVITPVVYPTWDYSSIYSGISSGSSVLTSYQTNYYTQASSSLSYYPSSPGTAYFADIDQFVNNSGYAGSSSYYGDFVTEGAAMVGFVVGSIAKGVSDPVHVVTGEFYIDAVDLKLDGPMPLEIRRNYSSQNLSNNEFGFGWKLTYFPYLVVANGDDKIYAAEMDGSVVVYHRKAFPNNSRWEVRAADNPHLCNVMGDKMGSSSNIFNAYIEKTLQGGDTIYTLFGPSGDKRIFKNRTFAISSLSRTRPYLEKWEDNKGNFYTFTSGTNANDPDYGKVKRIASSNGNFLGFSYNAFGHVTEAYTGDGRRLYYRYDQHGDLVEVTLADASKIGYDYKHDTQTVDGKSEFYSKHLLVRERKPGGRILENEYDSDRRVVSQKATVGTDLIPVTNATFVYSNTTNADMTVTGSTTLKDAYNRTTTYVYVNSQITLLKDANGDQITQDWYWEDDAPNGGYRRSLKQRIDKRGLVTDYKYDTSGNLKEVKTTGDITGDGVSDTATFSYNYNSSNLLTDVTDPIGNVTKLVYSDTVYPWQPTSVESWSGSTTLISKTVNAYTQVQTGTATPFARGLLGTQTRAQGTTDEAVTAWTYNAAGFPLTLTRYTGTTDPNVVLNYQYNLRGEMVREIDALGRSKRYAYDGLGHRVWEEFRNESGSLVGWNYDYYNTNGEIEWSDGPRYNPEDYVWRRYDGAGRMTEETRWRSQVSASGTKVEAPLGDDLYATTFNVYNLFGDLVETKDPNRNSVVMTYDAIGQLKSKKFYQGYASSGTLIATGSFTYEPGGQIATATDSIGGTTSKEYTKDGQLKKQTNPDGTTLEWRYGLDSRVVKEIHPDGTYWQTDYDDAGRTVTRTLRTSGGSVLATESQLLDRRGNVVQKTDAEGNVFTIQYDDLDRPKLTRGPNSTVSSAQQTVTTTYDSSGKVTEVANGLGEKTVTTRDVMGRPVSEIIKNISSGTVRMASYSYAADHNSDTVTLGSGTNAVASTSFTNTYGKEVLRMHGNGDKRRAVYDVVGNLKSSTDELGNTTTYSYDALNRLRFQTQPDGAVTEFVYDAAGNLLERRMPGSLVAKSTYDTASRKLTSDLRNGATISRQFTYTYYSSGTNKGRLETVTDPRSIVSTYAYDSFGRVAQVQSPAAGGAVGLTRAFTYDKRNLLTLVTQTYSGSGASPSSAVERDYDGYGQLVAEEVSIDGSAVRHISQEWDAAGRRQILDSSEHGLSGVLADYDYRADGLVSGVSMAGSSHTFGYNDAGLLNSRTNSLMTQTVNLRDGRGRILSRSVTSGVAAPLTETLTWRPDSTLDEYAVTRSGTGVYNENRDYSYNSRGRLTSETYAPASGQSATISYQFDNNTTGGVGVRTVAAVSGTGAYSWSATSVNSLARVTGESSNGSKRFLTASGTSLGAGSVTATIDGQPVAGITYGGYASNGAWSLPLELYPGVHTLVATAHHPAGTFHPSATSQFTVSGSGQGLTIGYNAGGDVTSRAGSGKTQTLSWDTLGRLVKVTERNGSNDGYDWSAVYDALGRRLRTEHIPVVGSVVDDAQKIRTDSWFDPEVEFLEAGVRVSKGSLFTPVETYWKVHGPDIDGTLGGMQGTGGLAAIVRESDGLARTLAGDYFGNTVASATTAGSVEWNATKVSGYGALPGQVAKALKDDVTLWDATVWRGRRPDPTGFYWMGARYYEPTGGRFLSADPMGHGASMSLYDYASNDPVNYFDPDGRFATNVVNGRNGVTNSSTAPTTLNYVASQVGAIGGSLFDYSVNTVVAVSDPMTYVNGAVNFGRNINTVYESDGLVTASSYALTSWNVGAVFSGIANVDLVTGLEVGDFTDRSVMVLSGISSTTGLAAGVMTAPAVVRSGLTWAAETAQTGGRSVIKYWDFDAAENAYAQIRTATGDVSAIAKNTGMRDFQVAQVKSHLFTETHQLDSGVRLFDADPAIANAWSRLEAGTHTGADIQLLKHELFESKFEGIFKTNYRTAHEAADRAGYPSGL